MKLWCLDIKNLYKGVCCKLVLTSIKHQFVNVDECTLIGRYYTCVLESEQSFQWNLINFKLIFFTPCMLHSHLYNFSPLLNGNCKRHYIISSTMSCRSITLKRLVKNAHTYSCNKMQGVTHTYIMILRSHIS